MRRCTFICSLLILAALPLATLAAQSSGTKPATSATKPAAKAGAAKPAAKPVAKNPTAIIDTTAGKLTCTLFPDKAPIGVANFIGLATGTKDWTDPTTHAKKHGVPLYDGTICHRVIPEFMIQCGDPTGTGSGDPGYAFNNETSPDLGFDQPGRLAYANAGTHNGKGTNGSQFFITEVAYPSLNGGYTLFGQCTPESVELVKKIAREPRNPQDRPNNPVKINHITIVKAGAASGAAKPGAAKHSRTTSPTTTKPAPKKP
jgi:peptidyl-prolyl cis-trans isomerase A (cyclophilin A)